MEEQQNEQKTESFISDKIKITAVVVIIAVLGIVFYAARVGRRPEQGKQEIKNVRTFSEEIYASGKDIEIPDKFPKSLPVPELNLIDAYIRNPDTKDITTVFESRKSAKENFDYYLDYARASGWQIDDIVEPNGGAISGISARKDNFFLNMAFEPKANNDSQIRISSKTIKPVNNIDFRGLKLE